MELLKAYFNKIGRFEAESFPWPLKASDAGI
jgi:hypothetical protein